MLFLSHCNSVPSSSNLLRSVLPPSFYLPVSLCLTLHSKSTSYISRWFFWFQLFAPLLTHTCLSAICLLKVTSFFLFVEERPGCSPLLTTLLLPANGAGKADSKRSNHSEEWDCGVKQVAMLMGETGRQISFGFLWNCSQTLISCKAVRSVFTSQVPTTSGHAHRQCLGLCLRVASSDFTEQKAMPLCEGKKGWQIQLLTRDNISSQSLEQVIRK